jgi:hypothetical protein
LAFPDWLKGGRGWAETDLSYLLDETKIEQRETANTKIVLRTGGRSGIKKQSLFSIGGVVTNRTSWNESEWSAVPPTTVSVPTLNKNLGGDGRVYAVLDDNDEVDITPTANVAYYSFNVWGAKKTRLDLQAVTYSTVPMRRDDGSGQYPTPQWTNDATRTLIQSSPVCFAAGNIIEAVGSFAVVGDGNLNVILKGEASGGLTDFIFWDTNATAGSNCYFGIKADRPLATNTVDFYNPLQIKWSYAALQTNEPLQFIDAGVSTNQMYVTWKTPSSGTHRHHTVVHTACAYAIGQTTESNIVAAIWSKFATRQVPRWNETNGMLYYGTNALAHINQGTNSFAWTDKLVKYADGQCGAWQNFFHDVLALHAIASTMHIIYPPPFGDGFIVGTLVGTNITDIAAVPAQNNNNFIPINFQNHGVNLYNGLIYDPSYGRTWTNQLAWEDGSVALYHTNILYLNITPTNYVPDIKGTIETQ